MVKILFLGVNPIDTAQLRLDEEVRTIKERIRASDLRDSFDIQQEWAVRVSDIESHLLRHKPHIVHFSGHCSDNGEIVFEDAYGQPKPLSPETMKRLFAALKDNVRCVVLNACSSREQAQAIAQSIDGVVGMSSAINDPFAISFASGFYQALGYNRSIRDAFELGRLQVELEGLDGADTPQLMTRSGVDPSKLYLLDESSESISSPRRPDALSSLYSAIIECHSAVVACLNYPPFTREEFVEKVSAPMLAFVMADKHASIYLYKEEELILAKFRGQVGSAQFAIKQRVEAHLNGQTDFSQWPMFDWLALDAAYDEIICWLRGVLNPTSAR